MCGRGLKWLLLLTMLGRWSVSHRSIAHIKKSKKKKIPVFFFFFFSNLFVKRTLMATLSYSTV